MRNKVQWTRNGGDIVSAHTRICANGTYTSLKFDCFYKKMGFVVVVKGEKMIKPNHSFVRASWPCEIIVNVYFCYICVKISNPHKSFFKSYDLYFWENIHYVDYPNFYPCAFFTTTIVELCNRWYHFSEIVSTNSEVIDRHPLKSRLTITSYQADKQFTRKSTVDAFTGI